MVCFEIHYVSLCSVLLLFTTKTLPQSALRSSYLDCIDLNPCNFVFTPLPQFRFTSAIANISSSTSENNVQSPATSKRSFSMVQPSHLAANNVPKSSSMSDLDYESAIYALLSQQDPFYDRTPWYNVVGR